MHVNEVSELNKVKLTFMKRMLSELKKRKKSDKMLIMNKTSYLINYNNLLINRSV